MTLQTNQTLNLPITLEVGALAETVTVSGDDPARQRRGDPQPADARDRVVVRPADAGPQLHRARDAGAGRFRARHDGRRTAGRRRHAGIGRRQLLDRNGRRRQRQRPGHGRQQVHHRRAQRDERHPSGRAEPDAEPRHDPGDEHPGQHLHVRVRRRQLDPDDQHDQVGIGAVPRRGQRLLQQRQHVREDRVHGAGRRIQPVPLQQFFGGRRRPDRAEEADLLLLRGRAAALVGVDGEPDGVLPRCGVRVLGPADLPEHVRHEDPEHLRAHQPGQHQPCRSGRATSFRRPAAPPPPATCPARRR